MNNNANYFNRSVNTRGNANTKNNPYVNVIQESTVVLWRTINCIVSNRIKSYIRCYLKPEIYTPTQTERLTLPRGPSVLSERAAAAWTPKESLPISTSWGPAWAACCGRDPRPWLFTAGKPVIDTTFTILFQYNTNFTVLGPDWHLKRPWYTKHPPNDRANAPSTSAAEQIQGLTFLKKNDHGKHLQDTAHLFTVFPLLLGTRCCIIFTNNYRLYVYTLLPLVQNRISASNRLLAIIKEVWV